MASPQPVPAGINPTPVPMTAARFVPSGNQTGPPHQRSLFCGGPGDASPPTHTSSARGSALCPEGTFSGGCQAQRALLASVLSGQTSSHGTTMPSDTGCGTEFTSANSWRQLPALSASIFHLQPPAEPELVKSSQEQRKISLKAFPSSIYGTFLGLCDLLTDYFILQDFAAPTRVLHHAAIRGDTHTGLAANLCPMAKSSTRTHGNDPARAGPAGKEASILQGK